METLGGDPSKYSPYLIITNGLTGSGKTSLIYAFINYFNLEREHRKMLIDDLVESDTNYHAEVDRIITDICEGEKQMCDNLIELVKQNDKSLINKFSEAYMHIRRNVRTSDGYLNNDSKLDAQICDAIAKRQNIVFETVGTCFSDWLLDMLPESYSVFYGFTSVSVEEVVRRIKDRSISMIQNYIENANNIKAPRLPTNDIDYLNTVSHKINTTKKRLMSGEYSDYFTKFNSFKLIVCNTDVQPTQVERVIDLKEQYT